MIFKKLYRRVRAFAFSQTNQNDIWTVKHFIMGMIGNLRSDEIKDLPFGIVIKENQSLWNLASAILPIGSMAKKKIRLFELLKFTKRIISPF